MQEKRDKPKKPWYKRPEKLLAQSDRASSLETATSTSITSAEHIIPIFERLQNNLGFLSLFLTLITIPLHLFSIIYALAWSKENQVNRGSRVIIGIGGIALAILAAITSVGLIAIASPILMMVGAAKGFVVSIWRTGLSVYDRFFGEGRKAAKEIENLHKEIQADGRLLKDEEKIKRLTKLTNQQRKRNAQIANNLHVIAMSAVGVVAVGLLFGGVTSAAGMGILIGLSVYGALDACNLNPVKLAGRFTNWAAKKITGKPIFDPFAAKTEDQMRADLYNKYFADRTIEKTATKTDSSEKLIFSALEASQAAEAKEGHLLGSTQPTKAELNSAHPLTDLLNQQRRVSVNDKIITQPSAQDEDEGEGEKPPHTPTNHH